jgi:hypothetical protein
MVPPFSGYSKAAGYSETSAPIQNLYRVMSYKIIIFMLIAIKIENIAQRPTSLLEVPRSRVVELYVQSPLRLHGMMPNKLSTGSTLRLPYVRDTPFWKVNLRIMCHVFLFISIYPL